MTLESRDAELGAAAFELARAGHDDVARLRRHAHLHLTTTPMISAPATVALVRPLAQLDDELSS